MAYRNSQLGSLSNADSLMKRLTEEGMSTLYPQKPRITVGMATCGIGAGAQDVYGALERLTVKADRETQKPVLSAVGCLGLCWAEPLVSVQIPGEPRAVYVNVTVDSAHKLAAAVSQNLLPADMDDTLLGFSAEDNHFLNNHRYQLCCKDAMKNKTALCELPFMAAQQRMIMSNCGLVDPTSLAEYVATGGYRVLLKILEQGEPSSVIELIKDSGLRGRGGAGFPTGTKWHCVAQSREKQRYFIVNADEGDPGAYMDRGLLESDPHRVLEGMIIGAFVTGCREAIIFIRSEYSRAYETLQKALSSAESAGFLGENIGGLGYDLEVSIVRSSGAFICGEETAMIAALEGYLAVPHTRPPYPSSQGLYGLPTCVNNVETLAHVPGIVARGSDFFRSVGTLESPGTKLFTLVGALDRVGLIEIPLGTKLKEIVCLIGGAHDVRAVQIGGPSGSILPFDEEASFEARVDYEGLSFLNGVMGSGGIVALGDEQCIVDTVLYCLRFAVAESCGTCTPCRDGLAACKHMLEKIASGRGDECCLDKLEEIATYVASSSLCSFGRMIPDLILSALRHFHTDFEEHVAGRCRALVCSDLIHFEIDQIKCQGERCCLQTCPGNAIKGTFGKPGHIVERLCTKCWMCITRCPYDAVQVVS